MNIKRKLKQLKKQADAQVSAKKKSIHDSLMADYFPNSKNDIRPTNPTKLMLASVGCLIICLITTVICVSFLPIKNEIVYTKENEAFETCSLNDIYTEYGDNILVNTSALTIKSVSKTFDSVSGDVLFFSIQVSHNNGLTDGNLYLVVNNKYTFIEKQLENPTTVFWKGYTTTYSIVEETIDDFTLLTCAGCIDYNTIKIYFDYEQIVLNDEIQPLAFLEDALILK